MANACFTSYVVTGSKEELMDFFEKMRFLENQDIVVENGSYGKTWLGHLVALLGGKVEGENAVYCRGEWDNLSMDEDYLSFDIETAWCEMEEFRHFVESCYTTIKFFYVNVVEDEGRYITNDKEGRFFPERYIVDIEGRDYIGFKEYEEVVAYIEQFLGRKLTDGESAQEALEAWADENGTYASLHIYEIDEE